MSEHPENNVRRTVATVCTKTANPIREVIASISGGASHPALAVVRNGLRVRISVDLETNGRLSSKLPEKELRK